MMISFKCLKLIGVDCLFSTFRQGGYIHILYIYSYGGFNHLTYIYVNMLCAFSVHLTNFVHNCVVFIFK